MFLAAQNQELEKLFLSFALQLTFISNTLNNLNNLYNKTLKL